jgi:copper(I)-binding protein
MRKHLFLLVLLAILLTACGAGSEETGVEVHQVTVTEAAQGESSELFMALHNHGSATDQLTGVTSDAAEGAELHNGAEVVQDIPVYANTEIEFTPEGYHVVLFGLKQELHVGDEIQVVLQFRDREDITVKATVGESPEHQHEHQEGS